MTKKQKKVLYRIVISVILLITVSAADIIWEINNWIKGLLYLIPYFIIGYDILKKAGRGIWNRQVFDENFLMAVATVGAILLGEYKEGVAVMLFYQIGELFQSCAVGKSRKNIAQLMDIRPDYANLLIDGRIEEVDPDDVEIGSEIVVNPGEKVPIDGIVIDGTSTLNTSALTGESIPKSVQCGDEVISGCINMTGVIHLKTVKEFGESTVSKILELVENSSMKKSRSENFITRFARYYTPAVCYSALALAVLPPIIRMASGIPADFQVWIIRALTFLVISCPCALVISIPLSFFGGIGCASSNGILVKGSNYLEALANTKYIVFDKTGTLTKGVFEVSGIYPQNGFSRQELLYNAAYAESASSHPISLSLKSAFQESLKFETSNPVEEKSEINNESTVENPINFDKVSDIEEIAGYGVKALVDGRRVYVGNKKLMLKNSLDITEEHNDGTVVYVAVDNVYAGCITISDTIKHTSKAAIIELKKLGIKQTVMLTGDAKKTADKVSEEIGIDAVKSELLPADKVLEVEQLLESKSENDSLAFVGDGINDAPVLSRADIGIAMGALGSDAAIEAADIVLMDDNPSKIALAMKISKRTLGIVKENIVFALAVKFVCLILGALGIANMWIAIFADVGVMVIAVVNATRALKIRI